MSFECRGHIKVNLLKGVVFEILHQNQARVFVWNEKPLKLIQPILLKKEFRSSQFCSNEYIRFSLIWAAFEISDSTFLFDVTRRFQETHAPANMFRTYLFAKLPIQFLFFSVQ